MNRTSEHRQAGFSVLEAIISLSLLLVVLAVAVSVYVPSRQIFTRGERRTDVQQNARLAMAEMSRQIRMAGFFPENFVDPPADPLLSDPVLVATDDFLAVHGDMDGSDVSNAFSFCLDGNLLRRGRAAPDVAEAYTCTGEILAENVTDLRFTYYDADGNPVPSPPAAPFKLDDQLPGSVPEFDETAQRESVRRVVVTLTIEWTTIGRDETYNLTSDVWLRNSG